MDPPQYIHPKPELDSQMGKVTSISMQAVRIKQIPSHMVQPIMGNDPRVNSMVNQSPVEHRQPHRPQQMMSMQNYSQNSAPPTSNPPMRTNLITVPIQDTSIAQHDMHSQQNHHYYPPPPAQVNYSGYNVPPPVSQTQNYYAGAQHTGQVSYPSATSQQQQYAPSGPLPIRPSPNGYMQDQSQYPPQQQVPTAQSQWSQHQQQFYR